jgi:RNA polymerase sigma-70 factor (ECF subfamily)
MVQNSAGQRVSFEELYDAHFDAIFRYVLRRVGSVPEAEDLTAQTFFKALRSLWRFRWSGGSFSSWLYRIATNEVNSHFRRRRPARSLAEPGGAGNLSPVAREALEAERVLSRNEMFLELNRSLRRLTPEEQALVVLRYLEEKPFAEIARILGKRTGAVTMGAHRALKKLKSDLEKRGVDHERLREGLEQPARPGYPGGRVPADATP